jgi:hypothetical protein
MKPPGWISATEAGERCAPAARQAAAHDALRRPLAMAAPSGSCREQPCRPAIAFIAVDLPAPLADDDRDLTWCHAQVDAVQDVGSP